MQIPNKPKNQIEEIMATPQMNDHLASCGNVPFTDMTRSSVHPLHTEEDYN